MILTANVRRGDYKYPAFPRPPVAGETEPDDVPLEHRGGKDESMNVAGVTTNIPMLLHAGEHRVLEALLRDGRGVTQNELADLVDICRQSLSAVIIRMEKTALLKENRRERIAEKSWCT